MFDIFGSRNKDTMDGKAGNQHVLDQLCRALKEIPVECYAHPVSAFDGATVGQHFRHILNFFECLLYGLESGLIDYSSRERHPFVETDPKFALHRFEEMKNLLDQLSDDQGLNLLSEVSAHPGVERELLRSSLGRELQYVFDHSVHHMAMIRIGLKECPFDIRLDKGFGVAPSTLKFRSGKAFNH